MPKDGLVMKRKIYRFLSFVLTASMLLSDIGPMVVSAAPETIIVSDDDADETISGNGSVSADETEVSGNETEIAKEEDYSQYTATADEGRFSVQLNLTFNDMDLGEEADIYLLLTDDENVTLMEDGDILSEPFMPYIYDGHMEFENDGSPRTFTVGGAGAWLKPGTTYYYRLLRKYEGEEAYLYMDLAYSSFQTKPLDTMTAELLSYDSDYNSVGLYWNLGGFYWDTTYSELRYYASRSDNSTWISILQNNKVSLTASQLAGTMSSSAISGTNGYISMTFPGDGSALDPGTEYTGILLLCMNEGSGYTYYVVGSPVTVGTRAQTNVDVSVAVSANSYTADIDAVFGRENEYSADEPDSIPDGLWSKYYGMDTCLVYTADADKDLYAGQAYTYSLQGYETCTSSVKDGKIVMDGQEYSRLVSRFFLGYESPLKPGAEYRYRVAVQEGGRYWFATPVQSFTTGAGVSKSSVNIDTVSVQEYGYEAEKIIFSVSNKLKEDIVGMEMVDGNGNVLPGPASDLSAISSYEDEIVNKEEGISWYTAAFSTSANSAVIRFIVYTGEDGTKTNIDYPLTGDLLKKQDTAARKISVSTDALTSILKVSVDIDPYYPIDSYVGSLYYKKSTESSYTCETYGFAPDDEEASAAGILMEINGAAGDITYNYYITVTSEWDPGTIVWNYGSAAQPEKYVTGKVVEYTRDDFKDKALYDALVKGGVPMTNASLENLTDLTIDSVGDTSIVSLDDLPDKMPSLTAITIDHHDIQDISPLLKLRKLKNVDLNFNEIETLPDISGVSWSHLSLDGNYIDADDILKAGFASDEPIGCVKRIKELLAEKTSYIDRDGKYPLLFNFPAKADDRTWTMTISANGVSKSYDSSQSGKTVCTGTEWYSRAAFIVVDAKDDFSLEKGKEYTFDVSIRDQYHEQAVAGGSYSIRFEEADYEMPDQYLPAEGKSVFIEQTISADTVEKGVDSAEVRKGDKVCLINTGELGIALGSRVYDLYPSLDIPGDNGLNYEIISVYGKFKAGSILPAGDYDLYCYNEAGEETAVIKNKIHVSGDPVVICADSLWTDAGCAGKYIYATVYGYNLDLSISPVITDGTSEYTNAVSIAQYSGSADEYNEEEEYYEPGMLNEQKYVFKLEKNANWDKLLKADPNSTYYLQFKGKNVKDQRRGGKTWTAHELWDLNGNASRFGVDSLVYNWKTNNFEGRVHTPSANMLLKAEIGRYDEDNYVLYGAADCRPDAKGSFKISFKRPGGNYFIPGNGDSLSLRLYSETNELLGEYSIIAEYYNYYEEKYGNNVAEATMYLLPDRFYYQEGSVSLNLTAYGVPETHKTDELFVYVFDKSQGNAKVVTISLNKADAKDGKDYFTLEGWKPETAFAAGAYSLELYETVDGKEVKIAPSVTIHVVKDRFTLTAQSWSWSADNTGGKLYVSAPLLTDKTLKDRNELDKFVKNNGLVIHAYDSNKKSVSAEAELIQITAPDGQMTWEVKGLDPDEYGYYFAITANGQYPKNADNKDYYGSQYGVWYEKTTKCSYLSAKGGYYGLTVDDEQNTAPYTLRLYRYGDDYSMARSITLKAAGTYYFTPEDMDDIDPDTIYTVSMINKYGRVIDTTAGYFRTDPEAFRDKSKTVPLRSLKITQARAMEVGESLQLSVAFTPADVSDKTVFWSSSDTEVATITAYGCVEAKKIGTTTITLKSADGKKTDSFVLNVIDKKQGLYVEFAKEERYVYTGNKITPAVAVYSGGRKLAEGVDYKVSYSNNINASSEAKLTVTGVTVPGKVVRTFTINRRPLDDEEVRAAELIVVSGKSASPTLYLGKYKLVSKDFTYDSKKKFTEDGTLTLCGKGNFMGTRELKVTVGTPKTLKVKSFSPVSRTYNGQEQRISEKELVVADSKSQAVLKEGVDYILSYQDDITSAGTVKVTIVGIGLYNNTINKTYKIQALKANGVSVNVAAEADYRPDGVTPSVEVLYKNKTLEVGKDYKVSFAKNKGVGKADVKVSFIGNYKGTSGQTKGFKVKAVSLSANKVNITCADMAWTKDAKLLSTPYVTMDGIEVPKANYNIISYSISGNDISKRKVTAADFGNADSVTVTVKLEGKGNMKGSATASYTIAKSAANTDLSKAKVEIRKQNGKTVSSIPFTGSPIEIKGEYKLVVTLNGTVLTEGKDYTVSYANNIYKGKASVIVTGLGDSSTEKIKYYGSKAKTFTITKGTLNWY